MPSFPNDHVLVYRVNDWIQGEATQRGEIAEVRFVDPLRPAGGCFQGHDGTGWTRLFGGARQRTLVKIRMPATVMSQPAFARGSRH